MRVAFKGEPVELAGMFPRVGDHAPAFCLTNEALEDVGLDTFSGKKKLLSLVPSIDTSVCARSTLRFNELAAEREEVAVVIVSADLPFAQKRFKEAHGLSDILFLSMMRDRQFARDYGVLINSGPLRSLCARAVVVLDEQDIVRYVQLVPEITQEPDYEAAFAAL